VQFLFWPFIFPNFFQNAAMENEIALAGHGAWLQNGWVHWQGETGHGLVEESSNITPLRPCQHPQK